MFNIIQPRSGLKVDVIVPAPSEFNQMRFGRVRRPVLLVDDLEHAVAPGAVGL